MGTPKALLAEPDGLPWLVRAVDALLDTGVAPVAVVLGAAPEAAAVMRRHRPEVEVVVAGRWTEGQSESLRAGLEALADLAPAAESAVVMLVDLPDVSAEVVRRVVRSVGSTPEALGRAAYDGRPGHPVVLGRAWWSAAPAERRSLLASPAAVRVECGDLATGRDLDRREDLPTGTRTLRGGSDEDGSGPRPTARQPRLL